MRCKIRRPLTEATEAERARFWSRVQRLSDKECWIWRFVRKKGEFRGHIGQFFMCGRGVAPYRAAYAIHYGVDPDGFTVRHRCNNSACVNPHHMALGTDADNMRDKVQRGEQLRREYALANPDFRVPPGMHLVREDNERLLQLHLPTVMSINKRQE